MSENIATEQATEKPKHGEFCWTEIATGNLEASKTFYTEIFGWQFKKSCATDTKDFEYIEFGTTVEKQFGGMFEMKPEFYGGETPKPHINIYVAVDNVDEIASRAFELGGSIVGPPMDVPGVGRMCRIQDPTGARFFVITPNGERRNER
ncbi:MAG TPA: VOC family protein [Pyrinomonadaceae bacterium]|jgi:predicted enzyme related to lactoylglutathione lyase